MKAPSHHMAFEVICLQLASDGRERALLGDGVARVRSVLEPFFVGIDFPDTYLEFPLKGDPFLDVTMLYGNLEPDTHVDSPAAEGTEQIFNWFADVKKQHEEVSFGFELDAKRDPLPAAAVHFQPRKRLELVEPFCELIGEQERARLYLDLAARMPDGWPLSFFGMFRGRPGSPLRVCGYLDTAEQVACAQDPGHLAAVFDELGFTAYDDAMLAQVSRLMAAAPGTVDFQFDVLPDGMLSDMFAIDAQFEIEQPEAVRDSFEDGPGMRVMNLLEQWGMADERWRLAPGAAFARAIPVEGEDGELAKYAFTLMPQWVKARWRGGVGQISKLYFLGSAGLIDETKDQAGH